MRTSFLFVQRIHLVGVFPVRPRVYKQAFTSGLGVHHSSRCGCAIFLLTKS